MILMRLYDEFSPKILISSIYSSLGKLRKKLDVYSFTLDETLL